MKEVVVTVGLVILGVIIVLNLILGEDNSMKKGSENLGTKTITEITDVTNK